MASVKERYRYFAEALATWLRNNATLATLTGYTPTTLTILMYDTEEELPETCLGFAVLRCQPMHAEVDLGLYEAEVLLVARAPERSAALDIMGAAEGLAAQNATTRADAEFHDTHVTTQGIQWKGARDRFAAKESERGGFISDGTLTIQWRET